MSKKADATYYQVNYRHPQDGSPMSIKARKIKDSSLGLGFIAISDFVFETGGLLVNPDEEARKMEFEHVKTLHLSIYSIQSITEVGGQKALKFKHDKANLLVLNSPHFKGPTPS